MNSLVLIQDKRIKTFDIVRSFATILVFIFHAGYLLNYSRDGVIDWYKLNFVTGTVGVCVFFVLSGFLLFYQLYKNHEGLDKSRLLVYIKNRLFRILPLYYFSIFFIIIFLRHDIFLAEDGLRSVLYNLIFIRGIKGSNGGATITINPVYWSLLVEMHFYFILPIFYYFFYKYKKLYLFLILIALGLGYRLFLVYFIKTPSMQFMRFTPANLDFFAIGMLGAYCYVNGYNWVRSMGGMFFQALALIVFFLFIYWFDLNFAPTISYIFAPIFLSIIIVFGMLSFLSNENTAIVRLFSVRPIMFIAKISFSIYIWHAIIIGVVEKMPYTNIHKYILNILITLVFSTITYYLIEEPFIKLKTMSFKQWFLNYIPSIIKDNYK
ncbi:MAG: acyltransferase [bacterium]